MKLPLFPLTLALQVSLHYVLIISLAEANTAEVQASQVDESDTALTDALTDLYMKKLHQLDEAHKRTTAEDLSTLSARDERILKWQRQLIEDRQKKQEQAQLALPAPTNTASADQQQLVKELHPNLSNQQVSQQQHQVTPTAAIPRLTQLLPTSLPKRPTEDFAHHQNSLTQQSSPQVYPDAPARNVPTSMSQQAAESQLQQVPKLPLSVQQQQIHQVAQIQLNQASQTQAQQVQATQMPAMQVTSLISTNNQASTPQQPLARAEIQRQQVVAAAAAAAAASAAPSNPQPLTGYSNFAYHQLYLGHNPFIEILKPFSYADDNIVTLNLSHSHIYEIDSEAFVGQRFEHIDLSNNKLGLIHSRSFRIGPSHSRHNPSPFNPLNNSSKSTGVYPTRRPPPTNPKSVTIDLSHNPAIVALSGAFDHIDVPNCLLNFTNSTVELKFGAFKKYFKDHPGHLVDIESVDCCEQEWLLGYKHNFLTKTHCDHDPNLYLSKVNQQTIIDSCIAYVTSARHSMTIQGPSIIHQVAATPRSHANSHIDNQYLTYLILGGTAMILTSLSIYIIFYMFSLKAAFVYQMQNKI